MVPDTDLTCDACLWLNNCSVIIVRMKTVQSSGPPCHFPAGLFHIFSLPVHHNTKHHLDGTTFSKTTLYTEHYFQNLYSRQAAQTNRSCTSITRVAETRATPLPQVMSPTSLRQFLEVLWTTSINFPMYRENLENRSTSSIIEEVKEFGQIGTQNLLDDEMAETSPVEKMSCIQSQMRLDGPWKALQTDLEDGELRNMLTSPMYSQRASGKPDAMVVQERGKCTNVSLIRRS